MRKYGALLGLAVLLVSILIFPGCTRVGSSLNGSGKIIDYEIEAFGFNSLNITGAFDIEIIQSESYKVVVSTDDNLVNRVKIDAERKTLKLSIEAPATFFPTSLKVSISMPQIVGLKLADGAKASISDYRSMEDFSLFLSEESSLSGNMIIGEAKFHLIGASTVLLKGSASNLDLVSLGGSKLDLAKFFLLKALVKLENESEAIININGQFDVSLNNKSNIYFLGNPVFTNTSISGGSTMSMIQK